MSVEFNTGTLGKVIVNSGTVALPFQPKSYEEELRACQRYYFRFANEDVYELLGTGYANTTTLAVAYIKFPVAMRIIPTLGYSAVGDFMSNDAGGVHVASAIAITNPAKTGTGIGLTTSGLTAGRGCAVQFNNTTGKYLDLSSEL
jgi:hypothetical protein